LTQRDFGLLCSILSNFRKDSDKGRHRDAILKPTPISTPSLCLMDVMQSSADVTNVDETIWTPTEHEGLLKTPKADWKTLLQKTATNASKKSRSAKGSKFMYACVQCPYVNDRLYHAKMHYQRIHLQNGRSVMCRRKYEARGSTESLQNKAPSAASVSSLRLLCRSKIAAASRRAMGSMRRVLAPAQTHSCRVLLSATSATGVSAVSDDIAKHHILTFGETSIDWTPENRAGLQVDIVMKNHTFKALVREEVAEPIQNSVRTFALEQIASGFPCTGPSVQTETCDLPWFGEIVGFDEVQEDAQTESIRSVSTLSSMHPDETRYGLDPASFLAVSLGGVGGE